MSEAFEKLIERAVKDKEFRTLLLSKPEKAAEGYDITSDELDLLKNIDEEQLDSFAGGLGDRTTKGSWTPGAG